MNRVPNASPSTTAIRSQNRLRPSVIPISPTASVASSAFPANHSVPWFQALPCRSLMGMKSME